MTGRWISFDERPPNCGAEVELASSSGASSRTYTWESWEAVGASCGWTHWRYYEPPTDLPPPLLPELPDGWEWKRLPDERYEVSGPDRVVRISHDGTLLWVIVFPSGTAFRWSVPLAVVDALREPQQAVPEP
jgi:hypothetical protein